MLAPAITLISGLGRTARAVAVLYPAVRGQIPLLFGVVVSLAYRGPRGDIYNVYNVLWAVVFGFATLNILSLTTRRFEPNNRGLSFGEFMAVMIVVISVLLLGWELLNVFHVFPLKLRH